ncbi:MAG: DMT family transporter [Candidatus Promineifilaceae bacterium]|nr:DMT family transporter [Candidatus Promineifilaceae bacterium]
MDSHRRAVLLALFVTVLWSSSWVLIKFGLEDIPALPFAGLRYGLAFLMLVPFTLRSHHLGALRRMSAGQWLQLALLGIVFYAITQGAQFVGLFYLPAITLNLVLNFTAVLVAVLGWVTLSERPTVGQWLGTALFIGGVLLYFLPVDLPSGQRIGLLVAVGGMVANALSAVLGRAVNRRLILSPAVVTVVSMGIGAGLLLIVGLAVQGLPPLSLANWANIGWLAAVNSALAFTLWNRSLRALTALESSLINSTMMIQIPLLAWLFLGERPSGRELVGLLLAALGVFAVQGLARRRPRPASSRHA